MARGQGGSLAATAIAMLLVVSIVCLGVYVGLVQGSNLNRGSLFSTFSSSSPGNSTAPAPKAPDLATRLAAKLGLRAQLAKRAQHDASAARRAVTSKAAEQALPKVGLLFLTRGDMAHEAVWRAFLESIPSTGDNSSGQAAWEEYFAVHVHPAVGYSYPPGSLFAGREVPERVAVEWGQFSVMQAEINLLTAALADPLVQRFVLLSETCIPLYPPELVYVQLLSESRSRLNACKKPDDPNDANNRNEFRWHPNMHTDFLDISHWRKSGQWVGLMRKHAEVIVSDRRVREKFEKECWVDSDNLSKGQPLQRFCVCDEHYIPTLIASLHLENETDCEGTVTNAWWDGPYFHPRTWQPNDVNLALVDKLRNSEHDNCRVQKALEGAKVAFEQRWEVPVTAGDPARRRSLLVDGRQPAGVGADDSRGREDLQAPLRLESEHDGRNGRASQAAASGLVVSTGLQPQVDVLLAHGSGQSPEQQHMRRFLQSQTSEHAVTESERELTRSDASARDLSGSSLAMLHARQRLLLEFTSRVRRQLTKADTGAAQDWLAGYVPLGRECALFARKFEASSVDAVTEVVSQFLKHD